MYNARLILNKQVFVFLFLGLLSPALALAQNDQSPSDRFEQLKRRMDEQMRRMFPSDSTVNGEHFQVSPDSSAYFYFHMDTTFDGNGSHFFDFRSFDLNNGNGPTGFDQLFEQFFQGMDPFEQLRKRGEVPADDGTAPNKDDGLLPEERLRQQEGQAPNQVPKPKESSKVKTIRI